MQAAEPGKLIPFSPPDITESEIGEVIDALRSGWITTGARTKQFEKDIAAFTGAPTAVCLSSATMALELTLRLLGVGPGDEVITSAYTYTASAAVIHHTGARIILVDTGPDSYEMDYDRLHGAITERTKVIIPVDIGGRMCDYDRILDAVQSKASLFHPSNEFQALYNRAAVVADAAHSLGAVRKGLRSGQAADFTCFSFHAVKNVTTGEGGAVVWREIKDLDDSWLYGQYMLYSLHGQSKDAFNKNRPGAWEYDILYPGYKGNMPDILAAVGIRQLERYEQMLTRRKALIEAYDRVLVSLGVDCLRHDGPGWSSSRHLYMTRIPGIGEEDRGDIIAAMAGMGVACNVHYKPLPMMTAYRNLGFDIADYPGAYRRYQNEITLPLHTLLSDDDAEYLLDAYTGILRDRGYV